ncbi:hypothetical protein CFP56_007576 [Quercus suber]|uniref:Uncharacterized protein n=1 Tax=Quercus suber TaxID=58331 RepID=A0AAW0IE31_QUESU
MKVGARVTVHRERSSLSGEKVLASDLGVLIGISLLSKGGKLLHLFVTLLWALDKVSIWVQVHNIPGGCPDHIDRDCDLWIESDGTLDSSDQEYGA